MSTKGNNYLILIGFLDLLCLDIMRPSVPPTMLKSGGSLIHLGILASLSTITQMIAVKLCGEFEKIIGNRKLLKYSLLASTFLNASLLFTSTATGIVLNRIAFAFAYQIPILCGKMVNKDARTGAIYKNLRVQNLASALFGSAAVGSIIDEKWGFSVLVIISSVISIIAIVTAFRLESEEKQEKPPSISGILEISRKTLNDIKTSISNVDIDMKNRNVLLIKFLLMSHTLVVFILFVVLIIFRFQGKGSTVCSVAAYQTIIMASIEYGFDKLDNLVRHKNHAKILKISALICGISAIFTGFAPSIPFYCAIFIPLAISRKFVDKYYVEVFQINKNEKLSADLKTFTIIAQLTSPLIITTLLALLLLNAYRLISIGTMIGIYFIVKSSEVKDSVKDADEKNKKE